MRAEHGARGGRLHHHRRVLVTAGGPLCRSSNAGLMRGHDSAAYTYVCMQNVEKGKKGAST